MGMALWRASIAFGGVHAAASNEYFPSIGEGWLWRSSSLYIMWSGGVWLTINFLGHMSCAFDDYWNRVLAGRAGKISYVALIVVCTMCGLAYAFARVFLIVESVISLRRMPISMYYSPNWSQLVPHLWVFYRKQTPQLRFLYISARLSYLAHG